MQRSQYWWRAGLSAVAFAALSVSAAKGQEAQPYDQSGQLWTGVSQQTAAQNVAYSSAADLAAEVEKLKESVKKMEDKAKDDKKKAASKPTAEIFGRTYVDTAWFSQDDLNRSAAGVGNANNGFGFRTARIGVKGKGFDVIEYSTEIDFVGPINDADAPAGRLIGDGVVFKDVWMSINELPLVGSIKIGHFKAPFSLEELTSSRNISFMERSMNDSLFVPSRKLGIAIADYSDDQRMTWALGAFQTDLTSAPPSRNSDFLANQLVTRVTYLPWYDEATEGRGLFHTGAGYYYAEAPSATKTFSSKPNAAFGPTVISSGALALSDWQVFNLEAAYVYGPFSLQGEYYGAVANPTNGALDDANFSGFYVMTSFFLTGENRPYSRKHGSFDKVKPYENFFRVRTEDGNVETGLGAWEILYRFDYADLYDTPVPGANILGQCSTHTLGVNWYLTPYARVMANYIHAAPTRNQADAGNLDAFMTRCQIDF